MFSLSTLVFTAFSCIFIGFVVGSAITYLLCKTLNVKSSNIEAHKDSSTDIKQEIVSNNSREEVNVSIPLNRKEKSIDEKFCGDCGETIKIKAEICPKCGVRQLTSPSTFGGVHNGKSKIAAALLAFFLGSFGIHKFYLGQVGRGVIYLLFCWTLIPAIISFIEFIIFLTMSDESFNRKYGYK